LLDKTLPITCPLCGKKNQFPVANLKEGAPLQCPNCQVKLTIHGHMWEEIKRDIDKMEQEH
jgi:hypothetical protein